LKIREGASPPLFKNSTPLKIEEETQESQREAKPLLKNLLPLMLRIHLPITERGIKGVRLVNNL
jgi:hypothetical protein